MSWVIIGAAWLVLAVLLALLIGRTVRIADAQEANDAADEPNFVIDPSPVGTATWPDGWDIPLHPPTDRDHTTIPGLPVSRPSPPPPTGPRAERPAPGLDPPATGRPRTG
jgi:hypothetical protein